MELPYIRVGTTYYKKVNIPLISGDKLEKLIYWNSECIRQDLGKDVLASIPKYDGFCHMPSHTNYQEASTKSGKLHENHRIPKAHI